MIAAAAVAQPVVKQMSFNWFDAVVIIILLFGIFRGRRNGMSKEFLPLLQWVVFVPACGFLYPMAGQFYINTFRWDKLTSYVCGYITLAFVVLLVFGVLRKMFAERLEKSDAFKNGEYYLGMLSGMVRATCILIVLLALLNAPAYTQADIDAHKAYIQKTYGGGQEGYSGDYFPSLQGIQQQVFQESFVGPLVKQDIGILLINNTAAPMQAPPPPKPKPKPIIQLGGQTISPKK